MLNIDPTVLKKYIEQHFAYKQVLANCESAKKRHDELNQWHNRVDQARQNAINSPEGQLVIKNIEEKYGKDEWTVYFEEDYHGIKVKHDYITIQHDSDDTSTDLFPPSSSDDDEDDMYLCLDHKQIDWTYPERDQARELMDKLFEVKKQMESMQTPDFLFLSSVIDAAIANPDSSLAKDFLDEVKANGYLSEITA